MLAGAPAPRAPVGGGSVHPPSLFTTFTGGPQVLHFLEPRPIHLGTFRANILGRTGRRFRFRRLSASTEKMRA